MLRQEKLKNIKQEMRRLRTEILSLIKVRVKDKGDFVSLLGMVCV